MNVFSTIEGIRTSVLYPLMYLVPNSWRWQSWRLYFLTFGMKLTSSKSEVQILNVFSNPYMFVMNTMNTSQEKNLMNVFVTCIHAAWLYKIQKEFYSWIYLWHFLQFLKMVWLRVWVVLCFVQSLVTTCYAPGLVNNSNLFCHGHKGGWRDGEAIKRLL